jgi:hypothetical protein
MAVRWIAQGRVAVEGERVSIAGIEAADRVLINPCD